MKQSCAMMNDHSPDEGVMKKVATLQAMKSMGFVKTPEFDKIASRLRDSYFGVVDGRKAKRAKISATIISDGDDNAIVHVGATPSGSDHDSDSQADDNGESQGIGKGSKSSICAGGKHLRSRPNPLHPPKPNPSS